MLIFQMKLIDNTKSIPWLYF